MLVLGLDPGTKNFGFSLVEFKGKPNVVTTGMLNYPISDLVNYQEGKELFKKEVKALSKNSSLIAVERFQSRGGKAGKTIECVNIMIGLLDQCNKPLSMFLPATWKMDFTRRFGFKVVETYSHFDCKNHEVDASLIAIYAYSKFVKPIEYNWKKI